MSKSVVSRRDFLKAAGMSAATAALTGLLDVQVLGETGAEAYDSTGSTNDAGKDDNIVVESSVGRVSDPCRDGFMKGNTSGIIGLLPRVPCEDYSPVVDAITGFEPGKGYISSLKMALSFCNVTRSAGSAFLSDVIMDTSSRDVETELKQATLREMMLVASVLDREIRRQAWCGEVGNVYNGARYREMAGLVRFVSVCGCVDANSLVSVPSSRSFTVSFGRENVSDPYLGINIAWYIIGMMRHLEYVAQTSNLSPVTWVIAMRPELYYCLCDVYDPYSLDGEYRELQKAILERRELNVDASTYNVVIDGNVPEKRLENGDTVSGIYAVPLFVRGSDPVSYVEYIDWRNEQGDEDSLPDYVVDEMRERRQGCQGDGSHETFFTDNGMLLWEFSRQHWDYKLEARTMQRVVCKTPQLMGVVRDVRYNHVRALSEACETARF